MSKRTAGSDVDAYCTKCKMALAHVVVAMDGVKISRVECKTCHGVHNYRGTAEPKKRVASAKGAKAPKAPRATDFDRLADGRDLSHAQRYRANESFDLDDVLDHQLFGLGIVVRCLADRKIEVVFRDGLKVLVHGR